MRTAGPGLRGCLSKPLPVTVLLDPGCNFLLSLRGRWVIQEAVVKAVFRNKILHILDFSWGSCSWGWLCGQQMTVPTCSVPTPVRPILGCTPG